MLQLHISWYCDITINWILSYVYKHKINVKIMDSIVRINTSTTKCFNRLIDCSIRVYRSFNLGGWVWMLCQGHPWLGHWSIKPIRSIDELIKISSLHNYIYELATHVTRKSAYLLNLEMNVNLFLIYSMALKWSLEV